VLVHASEDLLEDVFGVVRGQPERLDGDRVDVAREALHELVPRRRVALPASCDELRIGRDVGHEA